MPFPTFMGEGVVHFNLLSFRSQRHGMSISHVHAHVHMCMCMHMYMCMSCACACTCHMSCHAHAVHIPYTSCHAPARAERQGGRGAAPSATCRRDLDRLRRRPEGALLRAGARTFAAPTHPSPDASLRFELMENGTWHPVRRCLPLHTRTHPHTPAQTHPYPAGALLRADGERHVRADGPARTRARSQPGPPLRLRKLPATTLP